jgi:tetratricopeptide (TPR) repeat protein
VAIQKIGKIMKNKKQKKNVPFFLAGLPVLVFVFLSGCQSLQRDLVISPADEAFFRDLAELERTIAAMDASNPSRDDLAAVRRKIETMRESIPDGDFRSQMAAWSGRLYLMEGRSSEAQREYRNSRNLSPVNTAQTVLSFRLEKDPQMRLALIDETLQAEPETGEFLLERGRVLLDLNRFSEAVAAFDASFILLDEKPFYEEAYKPFRDKAWELRDLRAEGGRTIEIVRQNEISWKDIIELTKNENAGLLRFLTAGRDWPVEDIFSRLLERSFIPSTQNVEILDWPQTKPASLQQVTRAGAAWFLWRLYAANKGGGGQGLLTQYSSRYSNIRGGSSPIADLPLLSPYFDSILGCVESEFLSLPDGKNFIPNEKLRAPEYLTALRKLAQRI